MGHSSHNEHSHQGPHIIVFENFGTGGSNPIYDVMLVGTSGVVGGVSGALGGALGGLLGKK